MLNRSLENDLNRISVVAEDADEEGNGEIGKLLHLCQRDTGNYSAQWQHYATRVFYREVQLDLTPEIEVFFMLFERFLSIFSMTIYQTTYRILPLPV